MSRVRSQSAVAVSRLVGENELKDSQHFVRSMEAVVAQARAEPKSPLLTNFEKHAEELVDRILKLVTYASKIALNVRNSLRHTRESAHAKQPRVHTHSARSTSFTVRYRRRTTR